MVFTLEQVLDLITSMAQAINPRDFKSSETLDTIDFFDLPICKAQQLGIENEFREYLKKDKNFIGEM